MILQQDSKRVDKIFFYSTLTLIQSKLKRNSIMDRQTKQVVITDLKKELETAALLVISHQSGLTATESRSLRVMARQMNVGVRVLKNTLARRLLQDAGLKNASGFQALSSALTGPTVLTWSSDEIAAAKVIGDFSKTTDKIKIVAGAAREKTYQLNEVVALSKLPSLDALRGKLVGIFYAPGAQLARVLLAHSEQSGADAKTS